MNTQVTIPGVGEVSSQVATWLLLFKQDVQHHPYLLEEFEDCIERFEIRANVFEGVGFAAMTYQKDEPEIGVIWYSSRSSSQSFFNPPWLPIETIPFINWLLKP